MNIHSRYALETELRHQLSGQQNIGVCASRSFYTIDNAGDQIHDSDTDFAALVVERTGKPCDIMSADGAILRTVRP